MTLEASGKVSRGIGTRGGPERLDDLSVTQRCQAFLRERVFGPTPGVGEQGQGGEVEVPLPQAGIVGSRPRTDIKSRCSRT